MIIDGQTGLSELGGIQPVSTTPARTSPTPTVPSPVPIGPPQPLTSATRSSDAISQFHDWTLLANTQSAYSEIQASEYSLASAYQQLGRLQQQIGSTTNEVLLNDLQRWFSNFQKNQVLDQQLTPTILQGKNAEQSYLLEKADLLSVRPKDETITFFFRDTRSSVSVTLPGQSSPAEILQRLQISLRSEGIRLSQNAQGQLLFSVDEENKAKLDRPVQISGEGYRIPAGNPLTIRFVPVPGIIEQLMTQLMSLQPAQYGAWLAELEQYRRNMRAMIGQLKRLKQQLIRQLNEHPFEQIDDPEVEAMRDVQAAVAEALSAESYRAATQVMGAQANLSRRNVVALLEE